MCSSAVLIMHTFLITFFTVFGASLFLVPPPEQGITSNFPILILRLPYDLDPTNDVYVNASLDIIYNNDKYNTLPFPYDPAVINTTLRIGIHIRGQTSRKYPKSQYSIKFLDDNGAKVDTALFGLPAHSKWALYSSSVDSSLMRNRLAFNISTEMGRYAPRTHPVELFMSIGSNNASVSYPSSYRGVYYLEEKIERGKNSVDIHKMKVDDEGKKSITGGYIFKVDKDDWGISDLVPFQSNHTKFLYFVYPSSEILTQPKIDYLSNYISEFEAALLNQSSSYADYIDMDSWVDVLLIQEFAKNVDAYRLSSYFYKDREKPIVAGPIWDMDRTFGNTGREWKSPEGWIFNTGMSDGNGHTIPFWWPWLLRDPVFADRVITRYTRLRTSPNALSSDYITSVTEAFRAEIKLTGAHLREYEKWGPWYYSFLKLWSPASYFDVEVDVLQIWIRNRMAWLDANIYSLTQSIYKSQLKSKPPQSKSTTHTKTTPHSKTHATTH